MMRKCCAYREVRRCRKVSRRVVYFREKKETLVRAEREREFMETRQSERERESVCESPRVEFEVGVCFVCNSARARNP